LIHELSIKISLFQSNKFIEQIQSINNLFYTNFTKKKHLIATVIILFNKTLNLFTLCLPTNRIRFGFLKVILLFVPSEDFLKT